MHMYMKVQKEISKTFSPKPFLGGLPVSSEQKGITAYKTVTFK